MRVRLFLCCPECGKRSQTVHNDDKEFSMKCGDCLMERCEVVEMIANRVHDISEE